MVVKFMSDLQSSSDYNYTLVLPTLKERTETDLVGVTRVPLSPNGVLLSAEQARSSNYTGEAMVMTNFHDIFARHSFPLIDSLTALYTMTLSITVENSQRKHQAASEEWVILGNTAASSVVNTTYHRRSARTWTFEPSPPMPGSYLAFVIGRFRRNTGRTRRGVELNIWTLPGSTVHSNHTESTRFALEMTAILMNYFEEELDYPYPLSKMDIVEAPLDYEAFIVWGLCFVKPGRLHVIKGALSHALGGPATMGGIIFGSGPQSIRETIPRKKEITEIMAHEIAHQWFGSLVTPKTWNDVFLSESFATFYGVEAIRFARGIPQWMASEAMITALTHRKISLHTDPTIPISSPIMYKNWSRDVQFSTIVYHKGATLLRMVKWVIGDKAFRDGIRKYLRRFRYSNAGSADFVQVFQETVREHKIPGWDNELLDFKAFLSPFLYQPSYPIVNVRVNQTHAVLHQEPYQHHQTSQRQQQTAPVSTKFYQWYIPITVHLQSKHMKTYWLKPNETLTLPVSDFGFMVRLFHLYAVRPVYTRGAAGEDGEDGEGDEGDDDSVNVLD